MHYFGIDYSYHSKKQLNTLKRTFRLTSGAIFNALSPGGAGSYAMVQKKETEALLVLAHVLLRHGVRPSSALAPEMSRNVRTGVFI